MEEPNTSEFQQDKTFRRKIFQTLRPAMRNCSQYSKRLEWFKFSDQFPVFLTGEKR